MHRLLPLLLFLAATAAAQTDFPIAEQRVGTAPYRRNWPLVATSRDAALAIWEDERGTPFGGFRLWAARIGRDGSLLDPTGIALDEPEKTTLPDQIALDVASDGEDFLVVSRREQRLRLTRITSKGAVSAGAVLPIDTRNVSLVWLGGEYALFFSGGTTPPAVRVAILDREGRVLIPPTEVVRSTRGIGRSRAVVGNGGTDLMLTWVDGNDGRVHALRMAVDELRRGRTPVVNEVASVPYPVDGPWSLEIAAGSSGYLIAWIGKNHIGAEELFARRVTIAGQPAGEAFSLGPTNTRWPSVAWNGTHFLVTRHERNIDGMQLIRITPEGAVAGTQLLAGGNILSNDLASWGGDTLAVYNRYGDAVFAEIVSSSGALQFGVAAGGKLVSQSFPERANAEVVWRGNHYLGAWTEAFGTGRWIVTGRLSAGGAPLDGAGHVVSRSTGSAPSLASDGRGALLAWVEGSDVVVAFVDEAGVPTSAMRSRTTYSADALAHWNGSQYVVVWSSNQSLLAARFDARGNLLDAQPVVIAPLSSNPGPRALGWTGSEYVVFWTTSDFCFPICYPPTHLWALSFSPQLTPIGGTVKMASDNVDGYMIETGESRDGLLVVFGWRTILSDWPSSRLRAMRIAPNGTTLDVSGGFEIGPGTRATVQGVGNGWNVVSGPHQWHVAANGRVSGPAEAYPFVMEGQRTLVVYGGPAPLVVHSRPPSGAQQSTEIRTRLLTAPRRRSTR